MACLPVDLPPRLEKLHPYRTILDNRRGSSRTSHLQHGARTRTQCAYRPMWTPSSYPPPYPRAVRGGCSNAQALPAAARPLPSTPHPRRSCRAADTLPRGACRHTLHPTPRIARLSTPQQHLGMARMGTRCRAKGGKAQYHNNAKKASQWERVWATANDQLTTQRLDFIWQREPEQCCTCPPPPSVPRQGSAHADMAGCAQQHEQWLPITSKPIKVAYTTKHNALMGRVLQACNPSFLVFPHTTGSHSGDLTAPQK